MRLLWDGYRRNTVSAAAEVRKLGRPSIQGDAPGSMPRRVLAVFKREMWGTAIANARFGSGRVPAVLR